MAWDIRNVLGQKGCNMKYMNNKHGKTNVIPMYLQFFAESGDDGGADSGNAGGAGVEDEPLTFDGFLANKEYQAEFDRRVNKALETAKGNWEKDYTSRLEDAKTEAAKLAQMTAEQKAKYETEKKSTEIAQREQAVTKRELMAEAKNTLTEKGLPLELAGILDYANADACNTSIESVTKAFESAVNKAVEERLKGGKPPKKATSAGGKDDSADDFVSIIKENQSKR